MRHKLETFTEFARSLYPHEIRYLLSVQQFSKPEHLSILKHIASHDGAMRTTLHFDADIDKRTYSYLKKWISETLERIDVDVFHRWLTETEQLVLSDNVSPDREKQILERIEQTQATHYYFLRFYELLQHFRDYLLIRNRNRFYAPVAEYLSTHQLHYQSCSAVNAELNQATLDIVGHNTPGSKTKKRWEECLLHNFEDNRLDGYTRYRAAVRLTVLYYKLKEFDKLRQAYQQLDILLATDAFYSKRILANYYNNRAMMHSKLGELADAERYGYLSVQYPNSDYLMYLVNLCTILLKAQKNKQALSLMTEAIPEIRKTNSFYNKIGFVAFYMRTLLANNQANKAVSYGQSFFEAYKKDIFEHRWHLFFRSFLQVLLHSEQFERLASLSKRYRLVQRERELQDAGQELPSLLWYTRAGQYLSGSLSLDKLRETLVEQARVLTANRFKGRKMDELLEELSGFIPGVDKYVRSKIG